LFFAIFIDEQDALCANILIDTGALWFLRGGWWWTTSYNDLLILLQSVKNENTGDKFADNEILRCFVP